MTQCPICKKEVTPANTEFPFCSERCRIIDLGNWASEKYRIPSDAKPEEPHDGESDNEGE
jgi:endogenous inhibitor of DNA gyrase (YacG/DUF329 family)